MLNYNITAQLSGIDVIMFLDVYEAKIQCCFFISNLLCRITEDGISWSTSTPFLI
jgi:hypothetical protein